MKGFKLKTLAGTVVLASIIPVIAQESEVNGSNPLFSIPSLEAARQNHNNSVPQTTNSSTEVTTRTLVDPMLEKLKTKQDEDKLKAEIEKLKLENKRLKDRQGVERQEIPSVPASVLTENVPKYNVSGAEMPMTMGSTDNDIMVKPGVNQIVQIAVGHTNRIVTPFAHPQVSSASLTGGEQGEVTVKDNVVYVSTAKNYPLSMFITEKGNENLSISLTLVPRKIPSREINVSFRDSNVSMRYASEDAEAWEKSQPFLSGSNKNLRTIALQGIPAGYNLTNLPKDYALPKCRVDGFKVDFSQGQLIAGSKLHYVIGKVTNVSKQTLEFKESGCGDYDVAAVALYPINIFEPGESAEIYVIKHAQGRLEIKQVRASVLDK
ncbi:TraK domain-containing protein [Succinivibrio dextrinosolvens]|uniref:TraK domain-containing protein n=1 Tax=Succinivibrio dextrinosolvens TaxID=83771 RepID=UPI00241C49B8|nr:type-F conjugative transfer system secretin TraK [Succinivibrio dextrinosolvens]MBE6422876.1 conjugal transfer protein TraK [Succinivibrio dextrinosolvens]